MVGGQESARSLLHLAELFRLADKARVLHDPDLAAARMSKLLAVQGLRWRGIDGGAGCRCTPLASRSISRPCASNGTCAKRSKPARGTASPRSIRGATRSPRSVSTRRFARSKTAACRSAAIAAAGCFPQRTRPGDKRRSTTTSARSTKRPRSAPNAWCWWWAACRTGSRDIAGARQHGATTASPPILPHARARNMPLAIEPLHPMYAADRACVNTLAQALDLCEALGRRRRRRHRRLSRLVGSRPRGADRARRSGQSHSGLSHLRLAGADARSAARPRHDGRRRDRSAAHRRDDRGGRLQRLQEVEIFSAADWWKRPGDEVLRTCIERFNRLVAAKP